MFSPGLSRLTESPWWGHLCIENSPSSAEGFGWASALKILHSDGEWVMVACKQGPIPASGSRSYLLAWSISLFSLLLFKCHPNYHEKRGSVQLIYRKASEQLWSVPLAWLLVWVASHLGTFIAKSWQLFYLWTFHIVIGRKHSRKGTDTLLDTVVLCNS